MLNVQLYMETREPSEWSDNSNGIYYLINSNLNVGENRHFGQMGIMRLMFSISEPGACTDRTVRWPHLCEQIMSQLPGKEFLGKL